MWGWEIGTHAAQEWDLGLPPGRVCFGRAWGKVPRVPQGQETMSKKTDKRRHPENHRQETADGLGAVRRQSKELRVNLTRKEGLSQEAAPVGIPFMHLPQL